MKLKEILQIKDKLSISDPLYLSGSEMLFFTKETNYIFYLFANKNDVMLINGKLYDEKVSLDEIHSRMETKTVIDIDSNHIVFCEYLKMKEKQNKNLIKELQKNNNKNKRIKSIFANGIIISGIQNGIYMLYEFENKSKNYLAYYIDLS